MRIRLDAVHYEMAHRYEVNSGGCCFLPGGFSCDESISAYYENDMHGYHLMITRTIDGKMSFTSDFPRETGEAYTSLKEAMGSESYKGFVALLKRMNKYRKDALVAFSDPSKARRKVELEDVFAAIGKVADKINGGDKEGEKRDNSKIRGKARKGGVL